METCYMCEAPATSREHAPPRCIFPEPKDVEDGSDLRKNLITVPSCEEHNPRHSKDDEYFLVMTTLNIDGNERKSHQFSTKVMRALRRSPAFANSTFAKQLPMTLVDGRPAVGFNIDRGRIERVIDKTARAIYYHSTGGDKVHAPFQIHLPMLRYDDGRPAEGMAEFGILAQLFFKDKPWLGDNPEVFCYRLHLDPAGGASFIWMVFYHGFAALVAWGSRLEIEDVG
jgi:hypothetical protein